MNRVWRRFAIWLVVLVLPLQGLAAQAAMRCLTMPPVELPPCHVQALADGTMSLEDLVAEAAPQACAHCLAHAALAAGSGLLATATPAIAEPTPTREPQAEPPRLAIAFLTGGPDRPPRVPAA